MRKAFPRLVPIARGAVTRNRENRFNWGNATPAKDALGDSSIRAGAGGGRNRVKVS